MKTTVLYLKTVPAHTKAQFKAYCARRGKTMTEAVVEFMQTCAAEDQESRPVDVTTRRKRRA